MKYTKTTLKELTKRYALVLRKCFILNAIILTGAVVSTSANAETIAKPSWGAAAAWTGLDGQKLVGTGQTDDIKYTLNADDSVTVTINNKESTFGAFSNYFGRIVDGNDRKDGDGDHVALSGLTLQDSAFNGNTGFVGGAMSLWNDGREVGTSTIDTLYPDEKVPEVFTNYVKDTTFTNNSAKKGGAVALLSAMAFDTPSINEFSNVTFTGNKATGTYEDPHSGAGALYIENSTTTVKDSTFNENSTGETGGAIYNKASALTVDNTTFDGNSAYLGGSIYNGGDSVTQISNSTFQNNEASHGGVIAHYHASKALTIDNSTFEANKVTGYGGVIYNANSDLVIKDSTFEGNAATGKNSIGGVIYSGGSSADQIATMQISNSKFNDNKADWGGAVYMNNWADITVSDTQFTNNSAKSVGALGAFRKAELTNVTFENNEATDATDDGAGALFVGAVSQTKVTGGSFTNNTSAAVGGAIATRGYAQGNNSAAKLDISGAEFTGNTAATSGGAVYNTLYNSENAEGYVSVADSTFASNSAYAGGAIYNEGKPDKGGNAAAMKLTDVTFEGNTAKVHGGAIYNGGDLVVESGSFTGNTAHAGGAVSSIEAGSTVTLGDNIAFENNATFAEGGDAGGALYLSDATLEAGSGLTFKGNSALSVQDANTGAKGAAGAIYAAETNMTFGDNLTFEGNSAKYAAGALYAWNQNGQETTIGNNATFTDNHSELAYGGAIGNFDGVMTIGSNSRFTNNTAGTDGGAIANRNFGGSSASLTLTDATFTGNTAGNRGGAVYNDGDMTFNGTTTFEGNTANGIANDIHNDGTMAFNGDVTLDGGITGEGSVTFAAGSTVTATLNTTTILANSVTTNGANLNLIIADGTAEGTYDFVKAENLDQAFALSDNNLYDIEMLTEGENKGSIAYTAKSGDEIAETFADVMDETTARGVASMVETTTTNEYAKNLAAQIVALAQSDNAADRAKAGELAKATQPTRVPIRQAVNVNTQVMRTASSRMAQLRSGRNGGDLSQAKLSPWVKGLFNKNHNSQGDGFDAYTHGYAFGVDAQITEDWLVGLGYARSATTVKEDNRRTHVNGDNYFLYGKYQPAQWYVEGTLNYGHARNKEESLGLTGRYDVDTYGAQLFSGYQYGIADNYAGLRYVYVSPDDYDNGLNEVHAKNTQVATAVIGTRVSKVFKQSDCVSLKPEFRLAGTYDLKSDNARTNVNVIGGNSIYSVDGSRLKRAALESGVGLTATIGKMEVSADYDIEWRVSNFAQTGMLKLKYNF